MKRLIPVVLGTAAGTLLGAASFFAVDGLLPYSIGQSGFRVV
jgi:hypothetical protein